MMENGASKILLADNGSGLAERVVDMLEGAVKAELFNLETVSSAGEAAKMTVESKFDAALLVLDAMEEGLEGIRELIERDPSLTVIALSAECDAELAAKAIKSGAQDCLSIENLTPEFLSGAILRSIERQKLRWELIRSKMDLQVSEARFRNLIIRNSDAMLALDQNGVVKFANPAAMALFGRTHDELINSAIDEISDNMEPRMADIRRPDGSVRRVEMKFEPVEWENSFAFLASIRDVTDRKQAWDRISIFSKILYELNRVSEDGVAAVKKILFMLKEHFGIESAAVRMRGGEDFPYLVHDGFSEDFIFTQNSLIARDENGFSVRDEAGNPILECVCGKVISGAAGLDSRFFTPAGSFRAGKTADCAHALAALGEGMRLRSRCLEEGYRTLALVPLRSGDETIGLLQMCDRRENKISEDMMEFLEQIAASLGVALKDTLTRRALAESIEKYQTLFNSSGDPIFIHDLTGRALEANDSACRKLGYAREELLGSSMEEIFGVGIEELFSRQEDEREGRVYETYLTTKNGQKAPMEVNTRMIQYGGRGAALSSARDISRRKAAERTLARRMRLEQTLSMLSARFLGVMDTDEAVNAALSDIGEFLGVSRMFVVRTFDGVSPSVTHEWVGGDLAPIRKTVRAISLDDCKWTINRLRNGELVDVKFSSDIPEDAAGENRLVREVGMKAFTLMPMFTGDALTGALGVGDHRGRREWDDDDFSAIIMASAIIKGALDRKKASDSLVESRQQLQLAIEGAGLGTWDWNIRTNEVKFNDLWAKLLGYKLEELESNTETWSRLTHPDDMEMVNEKLAEHIAGKTPIYEVVHRARHKSGRWIFVYDRGCVVERDESGNPIRVVGTHLDITNRIEAEKALHESKEKYRLLVENSTFMMCRWLPDTTLTFVNEAYCRFFGLEPQNLVGKRFIDFIPEAGREVVFRKIASMSKDNPTLTYEHEVARPDGTVSWQRWTDTAEMFDADGGITAFQSIGEDITELKNARQGVEEQYRVQTVINAILQIQLMGVPLEKALKYALHEIVSVDWLGVEPAGAVFLADAGKSTLTMVADVGMDPAVKQMCGVVEFGNCFCGRAAQTGAIQFVSNLNEYHKELPPGSADHGHYCVPVMSGRKTLGVLNLYVKAGTKQSEKTERILQLFADIIASIIERHKVESERDSFREQLFFSQKMESIGQMAGGMAHDFNNQLAIIMGNAQLALEDLKESDPGRLEFKEIMTASVRARELTMKLLTFARREKINPQPLSVKTVVEDVAKLLKRSIPKKISVLARFEVKDSVVMMDVNQMHQALLNICNNAAAAMPDGGHIVIELGERDIDEAAGITVETSPGRYCVIKVSDTGTGMPPEVTERIFEPFFTTKPRDKGTGLGLAITYGIVKNHGGFIEVASEVGVGTSFSVYLPVDESETAETQLKEDEHLFQRTGTIMVVDDEKPALSVAERILRKFGFDVVAASNGPDAVKAFKRLKTQIDLVVLDIIMPGMDGADVFRELKALNPDVKVILASGYSVNGQAGAIMKEGAVGFVQKPFTISELGAAINHALSSR